MIYELRIYEIVPGRMEAIHARFANVTLPLFQKHGIRVVGFWEDMIGTTNRLTYILAYDNLAHRDQAWTAFTTDPEWLSARAKSEEDGPIVAQIHNTIMRPTAYAPLP